MYRDGSIAVEHNYDIITNDDILNTVGMIEISKKIILDKVLWNCTKTSERRVSKKEAFHHYLKVWDKIKQRLHAIHKADDRSTFTISDGLVDHI